MSGGEKSTKVKMWTIEELVEAEKVSSSVLAGVMAAEGWQEGKMVSRGDFRKAESRFRELPADGGIK